ncbi:MAG: hypothetical protein AB7S26_05015 [Sandaracinaceae bacterium]
MSDTEKLQRSYDALVSGFVLPLLDGSTVGFERPIAPGAIAYFELADSSELHTNREIAERLHQSASTLARIRAVPWPDRDLLLMAMAAYDLAYLTDPALDRVFARGHRAKIAGWIGEMVEAIAPPNTRADALARHALIDPFPVLKRRDVVAKSWAYTYRFVGRPIDGGIWTRPMFAKFKEQETLRDLSALLLELDAIAPELFATELLRALLSRSPVTELLRLEYCQDFRFGLATLSVLSDDALRGGIAREMVSRGEHHAAARLGRALGDPILQHAPPAHLYYALALCFEIQMTAMLGRRNASSALDLSDRDVARYAAVLPAFFDDPTMIDDVRAFEGRDRGLAQERCARTLAALPEGIMDEITPIVRRCQRPGQMEQSLEPPMAMGEAS